MTIDKAIEYLDVVLKAHPRLRPGDFGQAVKLGQEALKRVKAEESQFDLDLRNLLPGEDPE
ncbi:hypothetical protein ES708_12423 [subsurface metagenome]